MNALRKQIATSILDYFEELLEEKNIDIPSDDREGADGEARLYGTEYYELETQIEDILEYYEREIRGGEMEWE